MEPALATRRGFLLGCGLAVGAGVGSLIRSPRGQAGGAALLRPPGAAPEAEFLAACIRCGQCVESCPYHTLQMASSSNRVAVGTPYLNSRKIPCHLCQGYESLRCIESCPTTALRPVADWAAIRLGTAVVDQGRCLAFNRVSCRSCWHICPFPNQAIVFDQMLRPVVDEEACIGCGLCDHACPTEPSSISIRPASQSAPQPAARELEKPNEEHDEADS